MGEARDFLPGATRTYGLRARCISETCDLLTRNAAVQTILDSAAVVSIALVGAWVICAVLPQSGGDAAAAVREAAMIPEAVAVEQAAAPRSNPAPALFNSRYYLGPQRGKFLMSAPVKKRTQVAAWLPQFTTALALEFSPTALGMRPTALDFPPAGPALPTPQDRRSARNAPPPRTPTARRSSRHAHRPSVIARTQSHHFGARSEAGRPTIFQKLFGKSKPARSIFEKLYGSPPAGVQLAYAASEAGATNDGAGITAGLYDRHTAVYDISAHTVYLPNGTKLVAHSGRGVGRDNPRYANERDLGPTPPDMYTLKPRAHLFHGVRALRLTPVNKSKVFGRRGFLAHTYMLGPHGASFGCVSFKDYAAFLRAYNDHEITKLAVVASLN